MTHSATKLALNIKLWGKELGFADVGITNTDLSEHETAYFDWIDNGYHGEMAYMERHGTKRTRPTELEPSTLSIISVRLNYLDLSATSAIDQLHNDQHAYISRYALGKDYHKLLRKRLQALANYIAQEVPNFQYRAFTDSAPVLERPIAQKAGLGFTGKNSLIIHPRAGSWFFLGELYTNLTLPMDTPANKQGCGPCTACIQECPTQAIIGNGVIDARRCISYLTIEFKGSIAQELRPLMGNRIYGCDDCQLVCPWNKFTQDTTEPAFKANSHAKLSLDNAPLLSLWQWDEAQFLTRLEGSPIRRIGYAQWTRNLAIAIGNSQHLPLNSTISELQHKLGKLNELVDEHILWAVQQLKIRSKTALSPLESRKQIQSTKNKHSIHHPFIAPKYYLPVKCL
ncbi:MAG: tRNA epoxyqueuosine(34) reductase QueG [Thiomicrorhabdus sp.]|nr:tRNA epoxyqueuosine(34) reductase QueG [Thiomicrorhabdus sp.]